jgi:hypothetical protein
MILIIICLLAHEFSYEIVEGGFFGASYAMFYIHAKELNSKVKRRPSDFEWLS